MDHLESKLNDVLFQLQKQLQFQYQDSDQKQDQDQKQNQMDTDITTLKNIGNPQIHVHNDMPILTILLFLLSSGENTIEPANNENALGQASGLNLNSIVSLLNNVNPETLAGWLNMLKQDKKKSRY